MERIALAFLLLASGAAALIYEVLWFKQLGLLFGNTAQAAATTLAVFFAGISAGSYAWGGAASRSRTPLRAYALLEVAIAAAASLYFVLLDGYFAMYGRWAAGAQGAPVPLWAKLLLAGVILFPAAFFMGGTLPFMTQHLVRRHRHLGERFGLLYAFNTIGGAFGAFAAGFLLPIWLGFTNSYLLAISVNLVIASLAWIFGRKSNPAGVETASERETSTAPTGLSPNARGLICLAFLSGGATFGIEALWTRMFAQVLHNSVYSFATILVTFLVSLALGSVVSSWLARTGRPAAALLPWLLLAAGVGVGLSPFAFQAFTGGLGYLAPAAGWREYVILTFFSAAAVMMLPTVVMGTVFPQLVGIAGTLGFEAPAVVVGRLVAWNTAGSIAGSLVGGFVLIEALGLWGGIRAISFAYIAAAILFLPAANEIFRWALVVALASVLVLFDRNRLPVVTVTSRNEFVRATWETGQAIVAVTQSGRNLLLKLDNYYSLGGTAARTYEEAQADIPLVVHSHPDDVFFLGMGTGITAGAALRHRVKRVTVCELIPAVVTAAREHFAPYVNGLFEDPRVFLRIDDGRHYLFTTGDRYDVIVSDLFVPWQAGTGSLYTREHFDLARSRLKPGGLFAQWLPLYQLSRRDAFVIMRTMLESFPQVTLWRGDFIADQSIVALIGQEAGTVLDPEAITESFRFRRGTPDLSREMAMAFTGLFYAGNISANREMFADTGINTDDRPLIEYLAPIAQREHFAARQPWFTGFALADFQAELSRRLPPERDPYLARLLPEERRFATAGLDLFRTVLHKEKGDVEAARQYAEAFSRKVPAEVYRMFKRDMDGSKAEQTEATP